VALDFYRPRKFTTGFSCDDPLSDLAALNEPREKHLLPFRDAVNRE
jgi:hypothetical protein